MKINEILSISYGFDKCEKDTCVNSSGMNAMFDIPYNLQLNVKISIHMMNSTRAKTGSSFTNYLRSIVMLVFGLTAALNKFRFHSL